MRLFTLIDFHHFLLGLFLGVVAALLLFFAFRSTGNGRNGTAGEGPDKGEFEEYPEGVRIGNNPVPPVILFLFVAFLVWFVVYVVFFGILGGPV